MSDFVVINTRKQALECRHCEARQPYRTPIPVYQLIRLCNFFVNEHRDCLPPTINESEAAHEQDT